MNSAETDNNHGDSSMKQPGVDSSIKQPEVDSQSNINSCRKWPSVNCEERILFVVDTCIEEGSSNFKISNGVEHTTLDVVKQALSLYVSNKHAINPNHKYALMSFGETPVMMQMWTNHTELLKKLKELKESDCPKDCNLTPVFDMIRNNIELSFVKVASLVPDYIFQTIFIYGRNYSIPELLDGRESLMELIRNPIFFLDILYIHDNPSVENKCEGIYEMLTNLDEDGLGYVYEVAKNSKKCQNYFAQLLGHPLQRSSQIDEFRFSLQDTT